MNIACLVLTLRLGAAAGSPAPQPGYLYRAALVQAAPGKLLEVVDLYKSGWPGVKESGDAPPFAMRHSQGDRWDLLLLFPMGSQAEFYAAERIARRHRASELARAALDRLDDAIAWQEDVFVYGPSVEELQARFAKAGFFHVEMFETLPGRRRDLYRQREMENAYLRRLGLPENLIFVRESGAPWDLFTVGFYRDLKHYAEGADVPSAKQDEAAKAAGFENAGGIGPYLRTLIALHHDTLAVGIR
ncbi:MAG TPA: hypothetical protein VGL03_14980 [Thermoanaerobaculia bacterium]|jgi:hypothetical protein